MTNPNKKNQAGQEAKSKKRVIRLDDLDWTEDVVGGSSGKLVFGEPMSDESSFDSFLDSNDRKKGPGSL